MIDNKQRSADFSASMAIPGRTFRYLNLAVSNEHLLKPGRPSSCESFHDL